jgi:hypothetical protein
MTPQTDQTDWTYKPYAGAGPPSTPEPIAWVLRHLATRLALSGWTLRSGGNLGADEALALGCTDANPGMPVDPATRRRRIPQHEVYTGADADALRQSPKDSDDYAAFLGLAAAARAAHPNWDACAVPARLRHIAGLFLLLGPYPLQAPVPVHFVVYWADNGDAGQLVRYARHWNAAGYGPLPPGGEIELRNLAEPDVLERALARIGVDPGDFRAQWCLDQHYAPLPDQDQGAWPRPT